MSPENRHLLRSLLGGAAVTLPLTMAGLGLAGEVGSSSLAVVTLPATTHVLFGTLMGLRARSPWTLLAVGLGVLLSWCVLLISLVNSDQLADPSAAALGLTGTLLTAASAVVSYCGGLAVGRLLRAFGLGPRDASQA